MSRFCSRRPSPALTIACLALFVSLGGVSYAVALGSIGSRELRDNSVGTKDLRNNGIRGEDIHTAAVSGAHVDESSLGTVPSAQNAQTAGSATSTGGLTPRKFVAKVAPNGDPKTVLTLGGLTLELACPNTFAELTAESTTENSLVWSNVHDTGADDDGATNQDFGPGLPFDVLGALVEGTGTLTYIRPDDTLVTIVFFADSSFTYGDQTACAVAGTAWSG